MLAKSLFRTLTRAAALSALVAGLAAVSASAADASLAGTHWRLVSIGDKAADLSRREPFIELGDDGQISGTTGCNRFAGGYVLDGAFLSFGLVATTRMYCANVWEQERAFLEALPKVAQWRANGDRLELIGGNGLVLAVFQAEPDGN